MSEAQGVVDAWIAAWGRGYTPAARALLAPDAVLHVPDVRPGDPARIGFDELVSWYTARSEREGPAFRFRTREVRVTANHAVVLVDLHSERDGRSQDWMQVAVYRIAGGRIAEMWAFEDDRP